MFEIYTKEVKIKGNDGTITKYKLRPLNGRHLSKVFDIVNVLSKTGANKSLPQEEQAKLAFDAFDKNTIDKLHSITFETLKKSYPNESEEVLDEFTSQNLLFFMDAIISLNMPDDKQ